MNSQGIFNNFANQQNYDDDDDDESDCEYNDEQDGHNDMNVLYESPLQNVDGIIFFRDTLQSKRLNKFHVDFAKRCKEIRKNFTIRS